MLATLLDQADPTRVDYIAALTSTIGRLGYKLKTTLIDLTPLRQDAMLPALLTEARQGLAAGRISSVEGLTDQLYYGLSPGPDEIARSLVRLIAQPTDDVLGVITQLEALLSADDPLPFQQEERALLAHLEEQGAGLLNHSSYEVRLMAGEAVVRLLLPDVNVLSSEVMPEAARDLLNSLSMHFSESYHPAHGPAGGISCREPWSLSTIQSQPRRQCWSAVRLH